MNPRQLILLSPYRLPTDSTLYMADEEVASILSGHAALWHPAALAVADSLPRLALPHEHEDPIADALYVLPEGNALHLSDDWTQRARAAGALVFTAVPNRHDTLQKLRETLLPSLEDNREAVTRLADLTVEQARPFAGIGLAALVLDALCEAMAHDNVLPVEDLSRDIAAAVAACAAEGSVAAAHEHLQSAADRLLAAREILYPVTLHLIDLYVPDPGAATPSWPAALDAGLPLNVLCCAEQVARLAQDDPTRFALLRDRVSADLAEVIGGLYREREDPLLPLESQLWNLRRGQSAYTDLLGRPVRVFGRRRSGFHAQLPLLLQSFGITHCLFVSFDEGTLPTHHSTVVSWPSHDGKQVDSLTRLPQPADTPQTCFHLAHYLHQTIMQDQAATLLLLHKGRPDADWYGDLVELTRLAPVLGRPITLSGYFAEVISSDYTSAVAPDEFQVDYLSDRSGNAVGEDVPALPISHEPISGFAQQTRDRRRLDAAWTYATVLRSLGGTTPEIDGKPYFDTLSDLESRFEQGGLPPATLASAGQHAAEALSRRLLSRAQDNTPGFLLLNPCSFTRRVVVELEGVTGTLTPGGPVKAAQQDGTRTYAVVELPPVGFAWVPRQGGTGPATAASTARMRLADERCVRNEFFEAEIDPLTGGLKGLRDTRFRISRLGQQLVYNPGSVMKATRVQTTSTGPALGEIITEGVLTDESGVELLRFRQRFRAWLGRPMLEMRVELEPLTPLTGYPWHSYFAARFAWRDEQAALLRGTTALRSVSSQNRPESPDFVEIRVGRPNTVLFPGGLPFLQRHGSRMLDVLLLCQGETAKVFDLGIGLDREQPAQTALGLVSPVAIVPADRGPPHVGATGWLYQLDASNVLLTSLRPALDHPDGLLATLVESAATGGSARFHCARNPVRAVVQDMLGTALQDAMIVGDAVELDIPASDLMQLRVEFS